jgi:hypothetical protein
MTGGEKHKKESSSNEVDQCKRDILKQTIYEYVHKMQQLCLAYNLMQVYFTKCINISLLKGYPRALICFELNLGF